MCLARARLADIDGLIAMVPPKFYFPPDPDEVASKYQKYKTRNIQWTFLFDVLCMTLYVSSTLNSLFADAFGKHTPFPLACAKNKASTSWLKPDTHTHKFSTKCVYALQSNFGVCFRTIPFPYILLANFLFPLFSFLLSISSDYAV